MIYDYNILEKSDHRAVTPYYLTRIRYKTVNKLCIDFRNYIILRY